MKKLSNKGFTLVELIIVIAILAIIMLIAIPNFSGILQRQQVNADKNTAANIGKAIRIWYTQHQSDPAFRNEVKNCTTKTKNGYDEEVEPETLPQSNDETADNLSMIELAALPLAVDYIDPTYVPESLRTTAGATDPAQKYYIGLVGNGTYTKVAVCIANTAPALPDYLDDGTSGLDAKEAALYNGEAIPTTGEDAVSGDDYFKAALAYLEP